MKNKNTRALLIGIAISLLALFFAFKNVDLSSLVDSIFAADPIWMVLVLVSYMLHYWLKAIRWCDLLEPVRCVTTRQAYPVMMSGFFANNILPAHLGEFVRMYVGSKVFLVSKTQVLATILLERIFDFSMIALMFSGALVAGGALSGQLVYAGYVLLGITLLVWAVIFISLRYQQTMLRLIGWLLKPLPDRLAERILNILTLALTALHSMKSLRLVIRSVVLSFLQWALVGLAIYAALKSVGVVVSITVALVTLAATVLAVALPAAPGFFGTIQLAFVLALAPYGIAESDALAGSVIFHIISYGYVMISGVIVLHQLNLRVADLNRDIEEE